ncbi:MAG: YggS family pyridoxal phosphate-dependent enzyme [Gammaproteobacteria bacterium]|nr:YggS family pyridoxal phosphate-dependent enzyme [Gammaproteobacteria bacterium]
MPTITDRLQQVRAEIHRAEQAAQRSPGSVRLLAVSKTHGIADIQEALAAGQTAFGESYLQEALPKITALAGTGIEWHFIGPIQSNKTAQIAAHFDWVHSVDRLKIAQRLNEQRGARAPLNVCIQVNTSGESSKSGISAHELPALARAITLLPHLTLRGLMTIPAPEPDPQQQRRPFHQLKLYLDQLNQTGMTLDTLSMGMSDDLGAAIAEGATIVRVGTAIFGPRAGKDKH